MTSIGCIEAEQNLPVLLERVQRGEHFVITQKGAPVAQLIPIPPAPARQPIEEIIAQIKAARDSRPRVGSREIREMLEEGRR